MENETKRGFWERIIGSAEYRAAPLDPMPPVASNEPLPGIMPPSRRTGPLLTERTALTIPGVSRAVSLISGTVSQLPLDAYKQGSEFNSDLVEKPSEIYSRTEFLALTANHLAVYGNAYWLHTFSVLTPGKVTSMEPLNPELVTVELRRGRKVFHYGDKEYATTQIQHIMVNPRHAPNSSMVLGVGPIQDNRDALQGMLDLNHYASNWFADSGNVSVQLKAHYPLGADDAAKLKAQFYAARASGGALVLDDTVDYVPLVLNPEEAQFSALSGKAVTDVARMYGIPANLMLVDGGDSLDYSNVQDNDRAFIKHTLMTYVKAIEDAFTAVTPNGQRVRFNLDAFLRPSTKERYEALNLADFMTVNEKRALEDLPPKTGGNELTKSQPAPVVAPPNTTEEVPTDN